jgi:hypothetical protein
MAGDGLAEAVAATGADRDQLTGPRREPDLGAVAATAGPAACCATGVGERPAWGAQTAGSSVKLMVVGEADGCR